MTADRTDLLFAALADPTRRRIVELLSDAGEMRVSDIADEFDSSRQAITRHIDVLCDARLTRTEWRGRERYSALNEAALQPMRTWLIRYDRFWGDKLETLKRLIERKDA